MKMSKENYTKVVEAYTGLIERVGMEEIQNHIPNIKFIKDKNVAIVFELIRFTKDYYANIFRVNYDLGLNDSHIQTALIKACKELKIIRVVA